MRAPGQRAAETEATPLAGFTLRRFPALRAEHAPAVPGARPLVLLLGGCAMPAGSWSLVAAALPEADLLTLDRPGFAGTEPAPRGPTLESEVAALVTLLQGTARPAVVVAHSMAAFRAEELARRRPERVQGLVLVDPSVEPAPERRPRFPLERTPGWVTAALAAPAIREALAGLIFRGFRRQAHRPERVARAVFRAPFLDARAVRAAADEWLSYGRQARALARARARGGPVEVPATVLLAGRALSARQRRVVRRAIPDLRIRTVLASRHLLMIDRPEMIAQAVRGLAGAGGPGAR